MTAILEIKIKDAPTEKPKLSKVIDYDTHVKPYRFIQLISGLGSGKNYWVENDLMPKHNVLLITSRKAKVKERMSEIENEKVFLFFRNITMSCTEIG